MKPLAGVLVLLVAVALFLAPLPAQDKGEDKKDADKAAEKKDDAKKPEDKKGDEKKDEKKDEAKKDEKKDDEKKPEEKKSTSSTKTKKTVDPVEAKILNPSERYVWRARISNLDANSMGGLEVELGFQYPPKIVAAQQWITQQLQLGNRSQEVFTQYKQKISWANRIEVKPGENLKVRTMVLPVEYDSKGNLKRWTTKEVTALRAGSKLPGFPAQFDSVRQGQIVELYIAKVAPPKRGSAEARPAAGAAKKKKVIEEDESIGDYPKPEVLMIVVLQEAPMRP